ncbi:MAG TPA: FIST C-terminal domain-containing protein [Polyangiaceae bacterium]|nr:FIST C-terminal domain-containing protein [Polyangiaceae bacterium]
MSRRAQSFEVRSNSPERVVAAFAAAYTDIRRPAAGIVFTSGALLERQESIGRLLSSRRFGIPVLLVGGSGVSSERGELEAESAATGLVWSGGSADIGVIDAGSRDEGLCEGLERFVAGAGGRSAIALFVPPGGFTPRAIQLLGTRRFGVPIFGGGAVGQPGVLAVGAGGEIVTGRAVALAVHDLGVPRVRTAHSCRLLGPLQPITRVRGSMVLEVGGRPALDVLSLAGAALSGQPLVFTVLADAGAAAAERPELLVRGVQGIDPSARGLVISDEAREGMLMAFGVRDGRAAEADFEHLTRSLARDMGGSLPLCALYVNCGGRGHHLYGRANVDTRILRERFGELPIAGVQSAFEIAPYGQAQSFQLYTGVVALFTALS